MNDLVQERYQTQNSQQMEFYGGRRRRNKSVLRSDVQNAIHSKRGNLSLHISLTEQENSLSQESSHYSDLFKYKNSQQSIQSEGKEQFQDEQLQQPQTSFHKLMLHILPKLNKEKEFVYQDFPSSHKKINPLNYRKQMKLPCLYQSSNQVNDSDLIDKSIVESDSYLPYSKLSPFPKQSKAPSIFQYQFPQGNNISKKTETVSSPSRGKSKLSISSQSSKMMSQNIIVSGQKLNKFESQPHSPKIDSENFLEAFSIKSGMKNNSAQSQNVSPKSNLDKKNKQKGGFLSPNLIETMIQNIEKRNEQIPDQKVNGKRIVFLKRVGRNLDRKRKQQQLAHEKSSSLNTNFCNHKIKLCVHNSFHHQINDNQSRKNSSILFPPNNCQDINLNYDTIPSKDQDQNGKYESLSNYYESKYTKCQKCQNPINYLNQEKNKTKDTKKENEFQPWMSIQNQEKEESELISFLFEENDYSKSSSINLQKE